MSTNYPTAADDAREITSDTAIDVDFLQGIDDQIQALGNELVEQRTRSFVCCYPKADPDGASIPAGTVVALRASAGPSGEVLMVPATSAAVAAGGAPVGLLTATTAPGSRGRVAVGGMVPASVSGLAAGVDQYVRANSSTGLAERAALLGPLDVALGLASPDGAVVIQPVERASFQPFAMVRINSATGTASIVAVRGLEAGDFTITNTSTGEVRVQIPTGLPAIEFPRATVVGAFGGTIIEVDIIDSRTVDVYTYNPAGAAMDANFALELG